MVQRAFVERGWQKSLPAWSAVAGLAVGLQVFVTLPVGSLGLRVAAADLLIIPIFVGLGLMVWRQGDLLGSIALTRPITMSIVGLSLLMTVALAVGRHNVGEWLPWAVINRWVGWWVLLVYFVVGIWMRRFFDRSLIEGAFMILLVVSWMSALYSLALHEIFLLGISEFVYPRLKGFFENPNAFGCALAVFMMIQLAYLRAGKLFPAATHMIGLSVMLLALILSGSRSAWLGGLGGVAVLALLRQIRLRHAAVIVASTAALFLLIYGIAIATPLVRDAWRAEPQGSALLSGVLDRTYVIRDYSDSGLASRLRINEQALRYWYGSPIIGIGLGTFHARAKPQEDGRPATIHTTGLWLLTEMGAVGLAGFAGFVVVVFVTLLQRARSQPSGGATIEIGAVAAITAIAVASIGTELLYQRHIWWLLGLALAQPASLEPSTKPPATW